MRYHAGEVSETMMPDDQPDLPLVGPLVLAVDVGTSSTRAAVVDGAGQMLSRTLRQVGYRLRTTPDGGAELDPVTLLAAVTSTIDATLEAAGNAAAQIRAVGISTFWHSIMGLGAAGEPQTPLYTWADTRAAPVVARLATTLNAEAYHQRTGAILHASYPLAKLAWLRATRPALHQSVARWVSFGEYLSLRLTGAATCSVSMASGTGLFHQARATWDPEALAVAGIEPSQLSAIDDTPQFGLHAAYARRWPALADAAWFPAWGDGACSNLGSGAIGQDRLALMVGTTGAMRLLWKSAPLAPPKGLWLYRLDREHVLLGGALSEGGNLYEWARERLRLPAPEVLAAELAAMPPDAHGLTWLPFLAGERSPGWHSAARGVISGLTLDTSPVAILRAGMEAVAYRFALIARLLEQAQPGSRTIVASGGGLLQNPLWMQIIADVLNQPVVASQEPEASLKGAALMALARLAGDDQVALMSPVLDVAQRFEPNPAHRAIYQSALARQEALYERLIAHDAVSARPSADAE